MKSLNICGGLAIISVVAMVIGSSVLIRPACAHDRYSGCTSCHGDFTGPMSPQGTQFPNDDKHRMHRSSQYMNTDCALCHSSGDGNNPFTYTSDGTAMTEGLGCSGCHEGPGLRQHHFMNGINCTTTCHQNDPAPSPENDPPPYYGSFDTDVFLPCNEAPGFNENWSIGDTQGLDNDGDNLYDEDDPDCSGTPCSGDTNDDGVVNVNDLNNVILDWGTDGSGNGGDITGPVPGSPPDGIVNVNDLNAVIVGWGMCP